MLLLNIIHASVLAGSTLAAAVVDKVNFAEPDGAFECTAYNVNGSCTIWEADGDSAIQYASLGKTVIVPSGTEFFADQGIAFENAAAVPGAVIEDVVEHSPELKARKEGYRCHNQHKLRRGNTKYQNCNADHHVHGGDRWQMDAHNCFLHVNGKHFLCCFEKGMFCPPWDRGHRTETSGCFKEYDCQCLSEDKAKGLRNGECFTS